MAPRPAAMAGLGVIGGAAPAARVDVMQALRSGNCARSIDHPEMRDRTLLRV